MIRLEHVNLVVKEIQPTVDFLLTAFPNWYIRGHGKNRWGDIDRNWVHVGDDENYVTLNDCGVGENRDLSGITLGLAHIGFTVDDVEALSARLTGQGYAIDVIGRNHPHRKTIYFIDPAGFQFEFIEYFSEKPSEKNMYGGEIGELTHFSR